MEFHLTELQYSAERLSPHKGYRLYLYQSPGQHIGGIWFRVTPKYPDEEITAVEARNMAEGWINDGLEVRITNAGDELVFHSLNRKLRFPASADDFWGDIQ